jgi:hypothetical protein
MKVIVFWFLMLCALFDAFYNVLSKICGSKEDEMTEEWRKLYNEEINDLHSSTNIFG